MPTSLKCPRFGSAEVSAATKHCGVVVAFWLVFGLGTTRAADVSPAGSGIRFECAPPDVMRIDMEMSEYLARLGIPDALVRRQIDASGGVLAYQLNTPESDTETLSLSERPGLEITDEIVSLPGRKVQTVSKKEILLALLQHGRLTRFGGRACNMQALQEHVGLRQNIVAWAENLSWIWPDGGPARWNKAYWKKGTPLPGVKLRRALSDVFEHYRKYELGCYTATKIVLAQSVLDYYARVKPNPATLAWLEKRLTADGDPLVGIEPAAMWYFEKDFDPAAASDSGKLTRMHYGVAKHHFVPGDWAYLLNTDAVTYDKTGYEGSNAIYLGRNRFDDYYNDNNHAYRFFEKLSEVYQWRNGVFSRQRDAAKLKVLSPEDFNRLAEAPENGGLLLPYRVTPYYFGFE